MVESVSGALEETLEETLGVVVSLVSPVLTVGVLWVVVVVVGV